MPYSHAHDIQQQDLLEMIFQERHSPEESNPELTRGIKIYQNNLIETATRALKITYPVMNQLIGKDAMRLLSKQLLKQAPPTSGDWADWGESLNQALLATPLIDEFPFLFDVATLEWTLHQAARALNQPLDVDSLSLLSNSALESLRIQLVASLQLMESDYPIDVIWHAHQDNNGPNTLNTDALATELNKHQGPCRLLIYQQNNRPHFQRILESEFHWLQDVLAGHSLSVLLDNHVTFEFSQWLSAAIENQKVEALFLSDE